MVECIDEIVANAPKRERSLHVKVLSDLNQNIKNLFSLLKTKDPFLLSFSCIVCKERERVHSTSFSHIRKPLLRFITSEGQAIDLTDVYPTSTCMKK